GAEIAYYLPQEVDGDISITIADNTGNTVRTLEGRGRAGVQVVRWNFQREPQRPVAQRPLSPSERRDSIMTMRRVDIVADSLIRAGEDSAAVRRVAAMLKGEETGGGFGFGGGGGGGGGGVPNTAGAAQRPWVERPGEGEVRGGGGRGGFGGTRALMNAFRAAGVPGVPQRDDGGNQ